QQPLIPPRSEGLPAAIRLRLVVFLLQRFTLLNDQALVIHLLHGLPRETPVPLDSQEFIIRITFSSATRTINGNELVVSVIILQREGRGVLFEAEAGTLRIDRPLVLCKKQKMVVANRNNFVVGHGGTGSVTDIGNEVLSTKYLIHKDLTIMSLFIIQADKYDPILREKTSCDREAVAHESQPG